MADLRNFTYDNMVELIRQIRHGVDEDLTEIDEKIDKNTEDISDINDTVEGLVSQNINPNIFRGTNVYAELQPINSSNTWSTGEWCLYSDSAQPIELTDSPIDDVEVGWKISKEGGILQSGIPLENNNYTISVYVHGDGNICLVYLDSNDAFVTQSLGSDFSDWTYIAVTLTNTKDYQTFGFSNDSSSNIEICGMKLEAGDSETAWCPAYYDMENKYLQEDLDAISANITEVQNQVTENTTNISTAQQQITEIIAEGGEPNVIEKVQVNGATLAIEDKTVNVPVPTNVSELENDSGYITKADVPTKLSELTDDVGYAKESEIPTKISDLTNDSDFTTNSEVKTEIAAQIADIVAGAPESLDTLKEIADWIESHAEDAAAMNSEIKANAESISSLQTNVSTNTNNITSLQTQVDEISETITNISPKWEAIK